MKVTIYLRYLGLAAGIAALVGLLYLTFGTLRAAAGFSREVETPDHLVRLHIVNGSSIKGLGREVAGNLDGFVDKELEVEVVRTETFDMTNLPRTLVISRVADTRAARLLARRLGLDPSNVVFEPLEHNTELISATLVLGQDFDLEAMQTLLRKEGE